MLEQQIMSSHLAWKGMWQVLKSSKNGNGGCGSQFRLIVIASSSDTYVPRGFQDLGWQTTASVTFVRNGLRCPMKFGEELIWAGITYWNWNGAASRMWTEKSFLAIMWTIMEILPRTKMNETWRVWKQEESWEYENVSRVVGNGTLGKW